MLENNEGDNMELGLLEMLMAKGGVIAAVITWTALAYITATGVIVLTPTKKDDDMLKKLESIPLIGGMLKALINFGPKKK